MNIDEWKYNYLNNNKSGYYSKEKIIKDKFPDIYDILINQYGVLFSEKCYNYVHDIDENPKCLNIDCDNDVKFKNNIIGYQKTCSNSCSSKVSLVKRNDVLLNKYGVKHPSEIGYVKQHNIDKRKNKVIGIVGGLFKKYIPGNNRFEDVIEINCDLCNKVHTIKYGVFQQRVQLGLDFRNCITSSKSTSNGEKELLSFIKSIYSGNILTNIRSVINGELDIYIPDLKIAFEFNGLYWHSEIYKDKYYHYNKYKQCIDKDIKLIQIYEDEWTFKKDIVCSRIKNLLKLSRVIYARKCRIEKLAYSDVHLFLENNHLQGSVKSSINYGLFYNAELVSVMTFGKPRKGIKSKDSGNNYELYRFCTKIGLNVIGGASKLLSRFIQNYNFDMLYTYSHLEWPGDVYERIGFELSHISKETYWYFTNNKRVSRHNFNKHALTKLGYSTLLEAKKDLNILSIYGAGNKVLKYKII